MSVTMSEVLDLTDELERKTAAVITVRVSGELHEALADEALRLGLYRGPSDSGVAILTRIILRDHFASQRFQGNPSDHPVIRHLTKAQELAVRHYLDDMKYDAPEQREITQAVVKAHHALYEETA